jgi:3-hydroxyacyl-CoA dehydrogenase
MFGRFKWLAIVGVVIIVAAVGITTVFAADPPTSKPAAGQGTNYGQVFVDKLAGLLGIDSAKLSSSIKQAEKDTIDQAQKDGKLTQQQADAAKQRVDSASNNGFAPFGFHMGGMGDRSQAKGTEINYMQTYMKAVADKLGLSITDLQTQMKQGKSIADLAKEKNVTEQTLKDAGVAAVKTQLDQAVKDGKLTQAQADNIIERIKNAPMFSGQGKGQMPGRNKQSQPQQQQKPQS